jgi:hypothetical protein
MTKTKTDNLFLFGDDGQMNPVKFETPIPVDSSRFSSILEKSVKICRNLPDTEWRYNFLKIYWSKINQLQKKYADIRNLQIFFRRLKILKITIPKKSTSNIH